MKTIGITRGDTVTLKYQIKEDGVAKDITGMAFKFAVKERLSDATFKIATVDGTTDDAANGKFSFELIATETDQAAFAGLYEISMYDSGGAKTTLTPVGGLPFRLVEDMMG